jgi:NADH-quinone oxidoreductase subunit D
VSDFQKNFEDTMSKGLEIVKKSEENKLMTLSVGPQQPGSGHFRFIIKVDGDYIVHCDQDAHVTIELELESDLYHAIVGVS